MSRMPASVSGMITDKAPASGADACVGGPPFFNASVDGEASLLGLSIVHYDESCSIVCYWWHHLSSVVFGAFVVR